MMTDSSHGPDILCCCSLVSFRMLLHPNYSTPWIPLPSNADFAAVSSCHVVCAPVLCSRSSLFRYALPFSMRSPHRALICGNRRRLSHRRSFLQSPRTSSRRTNFLAGTTLPMRAKTTANTSNAGAWDWHARTRPRMRSCIPLQADVRDRRRFSRQSPNQVSPFSSQSTQIHIAAPLIGVERRVTRV